jgi:hypothetical protein
MTRILRIVPAGVCSSSLHAAKRFFVNDLGMSLAPVLSECAIHNDEERTEARGIVTPHGEIRVIRDQVFRPWRDEHL